MKKRNNYLYTVHVLYLCCRYLYFICSNCIDEIVSSKAIWCFPLNCNIIVPYVNITLTEKITLLQIVAANMRQDCSRLAANIYWTRRDVCFKFAANVLQVCSKHFTMQMSVCCRPAAKLPPASLLQTCRNHTYYNILNTCVSTHNQITHQILKS